MEEQKFRYAEKKEQLKRLNRACIIGYAMFYAMVLLLVTLATIAGNRSVGFTVVVYLVVIVSMIMNIIERGKDPYSQKLRYLAFVGLFCVTALVGVTFAAYYIRFLALLPLVASIIYFDGRFTVGTGIIFGVLNIITTAIQALVIKSFTPQQTQDNALATLVIICFILFICITERISKEFNQHALGSIQHKNQEQEKILQDVIHVAMDVQAGTKTAMDIVNQLNASTETVTGAMKDIADSTQSTAENIQTQTVMTQNIQEAIEKTLNRSEDMVHIADQSNQLNNENLEIMNHLKEQSATISDTNANVAQIMKTLQERAVAVNGIADTIFEISSQTNLLALNASIESARAGEAGRGFAVVADEIRQLAEKTRTETENIAQLLKELTDNAREAVGAVEQSVSATDAQDELINQASHSFQEMNTHVNQLTCDIEDIDNMLNSLSEANNQIVDNITQLSATTQEVTASSVQAEGLSNENLDNADETRKILDNVLNVSYKLDKYTK